MHIFALVVSAGYILNGQFTNAIVWLGIFGACCLAAKVIR